MSKSPLKTPFDMPPFPKNLAYESKFLFTCILVGFILSMPIAQAVRYPPRGSAARALGRGPPPEEAVSMQDDVEQYAPPKWDDADANIGRGHDILDTVHYCSRRVISAHVR